MDLIGVKGSEEGGGDFERIAEQLGMWRWIGRNGRIASQMTMALKGLQANQQRMVTMREIEANHAGA